MPLKSKIMRAAFVFCLTFLSAIPNFADTIRLKDGSVIKGKIVSFGSGQFTVVIGDGTRSRRLNFDAVEVESISFDADSNGNQSQGTNAAESVNRTNYPQTSSPRTSAAPTAQINQASNNAAAPPVKVGVKVLADNTSNGWTNSGWVVRKGQKIKIFGSGRVSLGNTRFATPNGIASLPDAGKLMPNEATGGLIAVIGDDNNAFIFIGETKEFTATRDGALFLGVNEGNLDDNAGTFDVRIEIDPNSGN